MQPRKTAGDRIDGGARGVVMRALAVVCAAAMLLGCSDGRAVPVQQFGASAYPERLSDWGVVVARNDALVLGAGVLPYDLNTPLFSDYAHKLRTIWMPPGTSGHYDDAGVFDLPVGTILSKTFYFPRAPAAADAVLRGDDADTKFQGEGLELENIRLIETRLLVHQASGWDALPYVWDEAQQDARLEIAGDMQRITVADARPGAHELVYLIPTRNECAGCHASDHTSGQLHPIGIAARHLNKIYEHYTTGPAPQLARWVERGYLDNVATAAPANALWRSGAVDDLDHRARSYLDINCGHCHNPHGAADTSGLFLNVAESSPRRLGLCKPPVAAGRGTGGRHASIVPGTPDASILIYRMASTDPGEMMPELGRTTVHGEGLALLRHWIEALPGSCT
jgi:uncharacterized repeat protein (TIGR03806 family)